LTTVLRTLRVLREDSSLDAICAQIGSCKKSTLSTCERWPDQAGPRLRKKLEKLYSCPWAILASELSGDVVSAAIVTSLTSKKD